MMRTSIVLLISLISLQVSARERYEFFNGARMMGMGGAGVAVVNDETALLVNPAGLSKLRDYFVTIADPEIALGQGTEKVAGADVLKLTNPQDALDKSKTKKGTHFSERAQVFPSVVVPGFGIGVFGKYEVNGGVDKATNKFQYDYTNDYAGVLGASARLFSGVIKMGVTGRYVNRVEVRRDDIAITETGLSLNSLAKEGVGLAADVGMMVTAPIDWLPTIAAVYRDAGDTSYGFQKGSFMNSSDVPDHTKSTLDTGFSIHPIHSKGTRSTWTVDFKDALNAAGEKNVIRRLHAGFEYNFGDAFFLRGGVNQQFWTAGAELAVLNYQFQIASYGEDIGTDKKSKEDRRYVIKFSFRF